MFLSILDIKFLEGRILNGRKDMKLSIVIVNYNTKDLTIQTIESVLDTVKNIEYEIFLVDNASADLSVENFEKQYGDNERINFIFSKENLGFAKGNNIALDKCKGDFVLLLNSDTIVKDDAIEKCIDYMERCHEIGALGPKILLGNGSLDHACKRGFPTPEASFYYMMGMDKKYPESKKYGRYRMSYLNDDSIGEVDALTGAFMMVRREVIEQVGKLDESFFMYAEDIDWCLRIKENGWKIVYYPEAKIIHLKGQSSKKRRRYKTVYQFHKTMIQFYNKHYRKKYNFLISSIVYIGIWMRFVMSMLKNLMIRK